MKHKSFFISTAIYFMAVIGLFADPTIKASAITGHQGTYAPGDEVVFTLTFTNTTKAVTAGDAVTAAQAAAANDANTAKNFNITGLLLGEDIYGNTIQIDVTTSGGNQIGPESTLEIEGKVRIPKDGTLHNTDPGYLIGLAYTYTHGADPDAVPPVLPTLEGPTTLTSTADILVDVPANIMIVDLEYPSGTFTGGDIIQITAYVQNLQPFDQATATVRPLTGNDEFRSEFFLTVDPSIDRNNDFLLETFFLSGDLSSSITGRTTVRRVSVEDTPPLINTLTRNYTPQPDDGFLDIGETVAVTCEVMIPKNYAGTFFVGAYADSINEVAELEEDVNATFGDQGDNIYVDDFTPLIRIASSNASTTEPVSEISDGNGGLVLPSNGVSDVPSVSEDGKWIAFQSSATNLDPDLPGTGNVNIYLRNRETEEVSLISHTNAGEVANRDSLNPAISADGRYIAYESQATNLVSGTQGGGSQIYVYDRVLEIVKRVSISEAGVPANGSCYEPSISEDGRLIAFESIATNLETTYASQIASSFSVQVFVHNRDPLDTGILGDVFTTHLVSASGGVVADGNALTPQISLDGRAIAFASSADNLDPTMTNGYSQIWLCELGPDGVPMADPTLVSVNAAGTAGGNEDSFEPAINGGSSTPTYGLQVAFSSTADDLIASDTNDVADIFIRDYSTAASPATKRVSVSNPRVAYGNITFIGTIGPDNVPANQPVAGEIITLNDGVNPATTLTFGTDVAIGFDTGETRDNLVDAINSAPNLNMVAYAADPPTSSVNFLGLNGHSPSIMIFNTVPGEQGNDSVLPFRDTLDTDSTSLFLRGMSGGGTQTGVELEQYELGEVEGSLQPSLDRSGRVVAFRSLVGNISVADEQTRFIKGPSNPTLGTPETGELIRPLITGASNVYYRDRDTSELGQLDQAGNTDTIRASVSKFGYPTSQLLDSASSGSSRMPALSANGRFIAFASDSTNIGGLRYDRTNRQPLDNNNLRDVFVHDRKVTVPTVPVVENPPFVVITSPEPNTLISATSPFFVSASAIGYDETTETYNQGSIESVTFYVNGQEEVTVTESPFVTLVTPRGEGPIRITATAEDSRGNLTTSQSVSITAEAIPFEAPNLSLVNPNADINTQFTLGESINLAARITQTAGSTLFRERFEFVRGSFFINGVEVFTTTEESELISGNYVFDRLGTQNITASIIYQERDVIRPLRVNVFSDQVAVNITDDPSPSVQFTSPTTNSTVARGETLRLSARPVAAAGGDLEVTYFVLSESNPSALNLGMATESDNYAVDWQVNLQGALSFFAVVNEIGAGQAVSSRVDVTSVVSNALPRVELTSMATTVPKTTVDAGSTVSLRAQATGSNGNSDNISEVRFLINGVPVDGTAARIGTSSVYELQWLPTLVGNTNSLPVTIVAQATTADGVIVDSEPVFIEILDADTPTVSIEQPTGALTITVGSALALSASASVTDGSIRDVEYFWRNTPGDAFSGNRFATDTSAPYTGSFSSDSVGTFYIYAVATSVAGRAAASDPVVVTIETPPYPEVEIIRPSSDRTVLAGEGVLLTAAASIEAGAVQSVEFFWRSTIGEPRVGNLIGTADAAPYEVVFTTPRDGIFYVYAVATSNVGRITSSAPLIITANSVAPPVVSDFQVDRTTVTTGQTVELSVRASSADLELDRVEFFANGASIGFTSQVTTETGSGIADLYVFNWTPDTEGSYSLSVEVSDTAGNSASLAGPTITVTAFDAATNDENFVDAFFQSLFGRGPTIPELEDALEQLDGSLDSRVDYVVEFFDSSSVQTTELAMLIYRTMTGEWPDGDELEQALDDLLGSSISTETFSGEISSGQTQSFTVSLQANASVTATVVPDQAAEIPLVDPTLAVLAPNGTTIAFNDDFTGLNPQVNFVASSPGTYTFVVAGFASNAGAFTLSVLIDNPGGTGIINANALTTALVPEYELRFSALNSELGFVRQLFMNKHGVSPSALSEVRLYNSAIGQDQTLGNQVIPGYSGDTVTYATQFALDNETSGYQGPSGLPLSNLHLYSIPNDPREDLKIALAIAVFLDEDPTDQRVASYDDMTLEEALEEILSEYLGLTGGSNLPTALSGAQSLGGDWYSSSWLGAFSVNSTLPDNWVYSNDLGWLYVSPVGTSTGVWLYSSNLGTWLWGGSTLNGYFYRVDLSTWILVSSNPGGSGAWVYTVVSGTWQFINP